MVYKYVRKYGVSMRMLTPENGNHAYDIMLSLSMNVALNHERLLNLEAIVLQHPELIKQVPELADYLDFDRPDLQQSFRLSA